MAILCHWSTIPDTMCDSKSLLKMEEVKQEDMVELFHEDPFAAVLVKEEADFLIKEEDIKEECNEQDPLAGQGINGVFLFLTKSWRQFIIWKNTLVISHGY